MTKIELKHLLKLVNDQLKRDNSSIRLNIASENNRLRIDFGSVEQIEVKHTCQGALTGAVGLTVKEAGLYLQGFYQSLIRSSSSNPDLVKELLLTLDEVHSGYGLTERRLLEIGKLVNYTIPNEEALRKIYNHLTDY